MNNIIPVKKFALQTGMGTLDFFKMSIEGIRHASSSGRHTENAKSMTNTFSSESLLMMYVASSAEPMCNDCTSPASKSY